MSESKEMAADRAMSEGEDLRADVARLRSGILRLRAVAEAAEAYRNASMSGHQKSCGWWTKSVTCDCRIADAADVLDNALAAWKAGAK